MADTPRSPEAAAAEVREKMQSGHNPEKAVSETLQKADGGGGNNTMMRQVGQAYEQVQDMAQKGVNQLADTVKSFAQEIGEALTPDNNKQ